MRRRPRRPDDYWSWDMSPKFEKFGKFLADMLPTSQNPTRWGWKFGWMPCAAIFMIAVQREVDAIGAQREHDHHVMETYKSIKKRFPYTYQKKWRQWCEEEIKRDFWWRKKKGVSYIEMTWMNPTPDAEKYPPERPYWTWGFSDVNRGIYGKSDHNKHPHESTIV